MKKYFISIFIILIAVLQIKALSITDSQVDQVLKRLDEELVKRDVYTDARQARIDSLKELYLKYTINDSVWLTSTMHLAEEYTAFNTDSALYYFTIGGNRARELQMDSIAMAFKIQKATYLPLVGFIQQAVSEYESIEHDDVPESMLNYITTPDDKCIPILHRSI